MKTRFQEETGFVAASERSDAPIDEKSRLVLSAADARKAGDDPVQELSAALRESHFARMGLFGRVLERLNFDAFRENWVPNAADRRGVAARDLVRLWQEGSPTARGEILQQLTEGPAYARVAVLRELPDAVDAEMLEAAVGVAKFSVTPGSLRTYRIALTICLYAVAAAGVIDLWLMAQWLLHQEDAMHYARLIGYITGPGMAGLTAVMFSRAFRMPSDLPRAGGFLGKVAAMVRESRERLEPKDCQHILPELRELTLLMQYESRQLARSYRDAEAAVRRGSEAIETLPVPAENPSPAAQHLPRVTS